MSGSSVHVALTGLVALWRAVAPSNVTVIDGPAYDPPDNFLAVGWDRSDQPAVTVAASLTTLSGLQSSEEMTVSSLLSFAVDAPDVSTARGQLAAAFDVFASALAASPDLGGVVVHAELADYDLTPILTEAGSVMDLRFTTSVQAMK